VTQWQGENQRDIATLQRSIASKTLASLVLEGYECALDVRCGDGTITMQLAERVSPRGRVLGIDTSTSIIAVARQLAANWPNVDFEVNDVLTIRHRQEFDLSRLFQCAALGPRPRAGIPANYGCLDPWRPYDAPVVCAGDRPPLWNKSLRQRVKASAGVSRSNRFDNSTNIGPDELGLLAESAGLAVTGLSVEDERWNFGSRDAFAACQGTFGAWTEGWPLEPKDEFIRDALVCRA
jgi:trans-aconitate 2-methyltransferase